MERGKASIDATYVLKVNNIQCCNACPIKIKRKLLRVSGVNSVAIDMGEGLIKISGRDNLDPSTLIKTVAMAGKIAQLLSLQNTPAAAAAINSGGPSNPSGNADELCNNIGGAQNANFGSGNFSGQIHINEAAAVRPPHRNLPFMRPPSQFGGVGFGGSRGFWPRMISPPFPPAYGYHRRPEPPPEVPPAYGYNRWPEPPQEIPPAYGYYRWPEPPPEAPPCCCQQHPPPPGSAPGHYLFNDDNIEGCAIA